MYRIDIMLKSLTLLFKESYLPTDDNNSKDLIKTVMRTIITDGKYMMMGSNNEIITNLKKFVLDQCELDEKEINADSFIQSISIVIGSNNDLLEIFKKTLIIETDLNKLNKNILTLKRFLNNYYKEFEIESILSNASSRFKNYRTGIKNTNEFIRNVITNLEALELNSKVKDPAISTEVDLGDESSLGTVMTEIKEDTTFKGKLKTGWHALNRMTSGGFKRGEFITIAALQHQYKSGFTTSLFAQIAMNNIPQMIDESKKPLLVLFSLEDDLSVGINFLYKYLYYNEFKEAPDLNNVTPEEASNYIKDKLSINGYHIKMLRIDPTNWSYTQLFSKVIEYEAAGYEIHAAFIDYLSLIPTVGCINTGPGGTDLRDLFRRVRNAMSKKKITTITPHQLSVDAKQLIRNGEPDSTFVKSLSGKGYYSGSRQLDQEIDLELYVHKAKINGTMHLTVGRGKHRGAPIIDEANLYFAMKFPRAIPIPEDIHGEDMSYNELKKSSSGFDF